MGNLAIPAPPPPPPTPVALAAPDPHRQQMAARYARVQSIVMVVVQFVFVLLYLTVFNPFNPAWSVALRDWARSITADPGGVAALYALALGGIWFGVMLPSAWRKGSKTWGRKASSIPRPVSETVMRA